MESTQLNRRAFLASAAAVISASQSGSNGYDDLEPPRVTTVEADVERTKNIAEESQLIFTHQVAPQRSSRLIVHFGIAHAEPRFSGLEHLVRPEVACTTPYMFASELLQESLGLKFQKALKGRLVGAICEGETIGEMKRSVFDPESEFKEDCSEDAKFFLSHFKRTSLAEQEKTLSTCIEAGKHYHKLSASLRTFRPEEIAAFKELASLYVQVAGNLKQLDESALSATEERIQRLLFSGRERLFSQKFPLYGAELPPKEHVEEARLILSLYNGGEALVGPSIAVGIQEARNARYIRYASDLLAQAGAPTPKVILVYLGCSNMHDLTNSVTRFNDTHPHEMLSLCRIDLPSLKAYSK